MSYEGQGALGVPLIAKGTANPKFGTASIAGGGTNAVTFGTTLGIIKYDGTSLVTSSAAKIDTNNVMTNTSQPSFLAYNNANVTNVTGTGLPYTCRFNTELFDNANNFASNTFTAPVAGKYLFSSSMFIAGIGAGHTLGTYQLVTSGGTTVDFFYGNPATMAFSGNLLLSGSIILSMSASETANMVLTVSNSTLTIIWVGGAVSAGPSTFSGCLLN